MKVCVSYLPSNNQANVKRVLCNSSATMEVVSDVMQIETSVFDKQKIDAEMNSLLVKLHVNDKQITGLVDSGAQMSVMARRH